MIKYNINLKKIMPVLSFILVLAVFANATSDLAAQIPPKATVRTVGVTQTPGGPPVTPYEPAVTADITSRTHLSVYHSYAGGTYIHEIGPGGTGAATNSTHPALSAVSCQFPPILETSNSTAMIVYKQEELGMTATTWNNIRFSALYQRGAWNLSSIGGSSYAYLPYNLDWALRMLYWEHDTSMYQTFNTGAPPFLWNLPGFGFFGQSAAQIPDPTPVEIYIKNGAEFTERGSQPVDKSFPISEGWVKVYDGYYDHMDQTQWDQITAPATANVSSRYNRLYWDEDITYEPAPGVNATTGTQPSSVYTIGGDANSATQGFNVNIQFDKPFEYAGGDVTIAFVNPAERRGLKTDIFRPLSMAWVDEEAMIFYTYDWLYGGALETDNAVQIEYPATYRFRCYSVKDSDVDGQYLGPKFQVGSQVAPTIATWDIEGGSAIVEPWANYGLVVNYFDFWNTWNTVNSEEFLEEWGSDDMQPSEYIEPYSSDMLTYSVPLTYPYIENDAQLGSVKPKIAFDMPIQSLVTSIYENGASFRASTQFTYLPGTITVNDARQVIGDFTIYADSNSSRLSLKRLGFNLDGTDEMLGPVNISVYHDVSATGNGDMTTSQLVGTLAVPFNTETYTLTPLANADVKLNAGENRFFFVLEFDEDNIFCNAPMAMTLTNFVLGNRENVDSDKEYTLDVNTTVKRNLAPTPVSIANVNNDARNKRICWDGNSPYQMVTFDAGIVMGRYYGLEWRYSTDHGKTWANVPGATSLPTLTLPVDQSITNYSCHVLYEEGVCPAGIDSAIWSISFESEIESIDFSYAGKLPHDEYEISAPGVVQGEFLDFVATAQLGDNLTAPIYTWELSSDNGITWQSVGNTSVLNYIVPAGLYGTQLLRVTARPDPAVCACRTAVQSNIFSFYVRPQKIEFNFTNDLPAYKMLCANDTATLNVTYSGTIDEKNSWWEKDGEKLYINNQLVTNRILKIANTDRTVLGSYRYRVKARVFDPSVDIAPYWADVLTTACVVDAFPMLEIFQQPQSNNYTTPGVPVALLVETSLVDDESPYQGFQWYKHTVNGDVRLTDNIYRFGSTSNQLVLISPTNTSNVAGRDVYTYNGEYYYLQITGPCSTITTRDNPIHILPGEGLHLTENAVNAVLCDLGESAIYSVKANEGSGIEDVKYQWYVDGVIAIDDNNVSGSQTQTFTINTLLDPNVEVYCEVTASVFGVTTKINSNTVGAEYSYLTNLETASYINNTSLTIDLKWETNNLRDTNTVNVYLNNNHWTTTKLVPDVSVSTTKSHQITIPLDDNFALLLIENPDILDILVEVSNECGDMISEQTSISVKDVEIEPIVPADVEDNHNADAFDILPNPVNDIVTIGFTSNTISHTTIDICDLSGKTIATLFAGDCQKNYNQLHFNLNDLNIATGTYIIRISNSNGTKSKHFVFAK